MRKRWFSRGALTGDLYGNDSYRDQAVNVRTLGELRSFRGVSAAPLNVSDDAANHRIAGHTRRSASKRHSMACTKIEGLNSWPGRLEAMSWMNVDQSIASKCMRDEAQAAFKSSYGHQQPTMNPRLRSRAIFFWRKYRERERRLQCCAGHPSIALRGVTIGTNEFLRFVRIPISTLPGRRRPRAWFS